jgi:uncharacterized protein (DUF1778 family)
MGSSKSFARLRVRLPVELKQVIEDAAAISEKTVNNFAVSALVDSARQVIEQHERTELSQRDWDAFVRLLEDENAKPNRALTQAAREYCMSRG